MNPDAPVQIGTDRQLFVDDFWIAESTGAERRLHPRQATPHIPTGTVELVRLSLFFHSGQPFRLWLGQLV